MATFLPAMNACALSCGLARFSSALTAPGTDEKTHERTRLSARARPADLIERSIGATGAEIKLSERGGGAGPRRARDRGRSGRACARGCAGPEVSGRDDGGGGGRRGGRG